MSVEKMSGKKKAVRGKSGLLTGLMIVSTGLIAGFHGFELATSKNNGAKSHASNGSKAKGIRGSRSGEGLSKSTSIPDYLFTAELERRAARNTIQANDKNGLANLIQSANFVPEATLRDSETKNAAPVVNRALKRDRAPYQKSPAPDTLTSFIQAANKVSVKKEGAVSKETKTAKAVSQKTRTAQPAASVKPVVVTRQEEFDAPEEEAPIIKASLNSEVPFADSADIALFAADMPLPAKLIHKVSTGHGGPLRPTSLSAPYSRSPLVPQKLKSGKAFGGLAEREFQKRERRCMTTALYFEARSEPKSGQVAVGQVIMNRVKSPDYPDTICGVIYQGSHRRTGCQFSFTCDGKADKPNNSKQWERSKRLANRVLDGKIWMKSIGNATHYHATYVKPRWRRKMARIIKIGRHIFYKSPKISLTDTYQRYMTGERS